MKSLQKQNVCPKGARQKDGQKGRGSQIQPKSPGKSIDLPGLLVGLTGFEPAAPCQTGAVVVITECLGTSRVPMSLQQTERFTTHDHSRTLLDGHG